MNARRLIAVAWIVGLVMAIAIPALAKGVDAVTLSGGGEEVFFAGSGEPNTNTKLSNLADGAHFFEGLWADEPQATRPAGELGPRITAEWHFPGGLSEGVIIVQYLYPAAEAGPVGHIPGGQEHYQEVNQDNWFPLAPDIVEDLAAVGFDVTAVGLESAAVTDSAPPKAAAPTATAAREATPSLPSASTIPWLMAVGLATGAVFALLGIMRRRIQRRA